MQVEKGTPELTWYKSGVGQEYGGERQSQESIKIKYYENAIRKMGILDVS